MELTIIVVHWEYKSVVRYGAIGRSSALNVCSCAKSPVSTRVWPYVSSAGSVARSSINMILRNMQSVCAPVCPAVVLYAFGITHVQRLYHWYY